LASISDEKLQELRDRVDLVAVVQRRVPLKKSGHDWKGLCPFHGEKTSSFYVVPDKKMFHCFGCGVSGDAIKFVMQTEGRSFREAVEQLAGEAGVDLTPPDPEEARRSARRASLAEVNEKACTFYERVLWEHPKGEVAREHLRRRGITEDTARAWRLGYAPGLWDSLVKSHALKGVDPSLVEEAGLGVPRKKGEGLYDRFRGRLMIPIRDPRGRVIAFGGRILGEGEPKYLNSPDTPIFDKGRTLYNIDRAGPASRTAKRLIVVEGYMDVIALDRAGIAEVVAPNGTAVTEAQLERMWRLDPSPILCFDGDSAGRKAAIRAAGRALPFIGPERTLRFVELPQGQDPDDLVRSGGREAVEALLAAPEGLADRLWRHELMSMTTTTTPEAWAGLRQRLLDHAATIGDPVLRQLYRDDWLGRFEKLVRREVPDVRRGQRRGKQRGQRYFAPEKPPGDVMKSIGRRGIDDRHARALVEGFMLFPEELPAHCEQFATLPIADKSTAHIRYQLVAATFNGSTLDRDTLHTILGTSEAEGGHARRTTMGFSFTRRDSDPERARSDLAAAVEILFAAEEVEKALENATERLKRDLTNEALEEQQRLILAQRGLRERLASLAGTD